MALAADTNVDVSSLFTARILTIHLASESLFHRYIWVFLWEYRWFFQICVYLFLFFGGSVKCTFFCVIPSFRSLLRTEDEWQPKHSAISLSLASGGAWIYSMSFSGMIFLLTGRRTFVFTSPVVLYRFFQSIIVLMFTLNTAAVCVNEYPFCAYSSARSLKYPAYNIAWV